MSRTTTLRSVGCAAMVVALLAALVPGRPPAAVIAVAGLGVAAAAIGMAPAVVATLRRRRSLLWSIPVIALVAAWIADGIVTAGRPPARFFPVPAGTLLTALSSSTDAVAVARWPWRVDGVALLPLLVAILSGTGGFVLLCDAVRVAAGLGRPPRSMWRRFSARPSRGGRVAVRALPGAGLIGVLVFLGVSAVSRWVPRDPVLLTLLMLLVASVAALLLSAPVAVGLALRLDVDRAGRAREEERVRYAAHLHDSVLQTLALIQRQAADSEAVSRLARRQEYALRDWMAGNAELSGPTLATAVRDMVAEVEADLGIEVELTEIGDADLGPGGEELVAAAREALRNAARHAPGAPIVVFLDIDESEIAMFVRDEGPGFDPASVPVERRGLRDSVIGRMTYAGGGAVVESAPGEGTEVVLRIPHGGGAS